MWRCLRGVASICCCHRVRVQWMDTTAALWVSMLVLFPFESSRLGSLWLTFFVHRTIFFYLSYGEFLSGGPSLYDQTSPVIFIPPPLPRMFVIIPSLFRHYLVNGNNVRRSCTISDFEMHEGTSFVLLAEGSQLCAYLGRLVCVPFA